MTGGSTGEKWRQSVTRRDVRYVPKRDDRALHDVTSDIPHERQIFVIKSDGFGQLRAREIGYQNESVYVALKTVVRKETRAVKFK